MSFEVGEYIGDGNYSYFFRLKKYSNLGVKIRRRDIGLFAYWRLNAELKKAKILRKLNISVPRYVGVYRVKFPEYDRRTVRKDNIPMSIVYELLNKSGKTYYGLIMEYIEEDLKTIDSDKKKEIYDIEIKKIESHNIRVYDSDESKNVLWSESKQKLYFIDFDLWKFP